MSGSCLWKDSFYKTVSFMFYEIDRSMKKQENIFFLNCFTDGDNAVVELFFFQKLVINLVWFDFALHDKLSLIRFTTTAIRFTFSFPFYYPRDGHWFHWYSRINSTKTIVYRSLQSCTRKTRIKTVLNSTLTSWFVHTLVPAVAGRCRTLVLLKHTEKLVCTNWFDFITAN